ncbi:MAG: hypothetical protein HYX69_08910 [Planctomycetia bacterium]|nr:hypothetical protein [Planctomycetia bacterium]
MLHHAYYVVMRHAQSMNMQQWFLALLVVVAIGLFCMRGFGSRSGY